MSQLATTSNITAEGVERALILQDLSRMDATDRLNYYKSVCESLGLNPLTQPFAYIQLNGKTKLYALKDCTEQLRKIHNVSIQITGREATEGIYVVTARATTPSRQDESIGAVPIENLKGEAKANAMMKAETKAKRRVTLSVCGLGMLDESEVDSIPNAPVFTHDDMARDAVNHAIATGQKPEAPDHHMQELEKTRAKLEEKIASGKGVKMTDVEPAKPKQEEPPPWEEEPVAADNWQDFVLVFKAKEWNGRKLGDLSREELDTLKKMWVDRYADNITKDQAKQRQAAMILTAIKSRDEAAVEEEKL